MSTIIILIVVGLLVWLYTMGYLLQAILCFAAMLGVGVLHEKLGGSGKKQMYGIPFGCALAFGLILWLFGSRWYICVGGPLMMLGVSTQTLWKSGGQKKIRMAALALLVIVAAGAFGLDMVSKNNLGRDARIAGLAQAFEDNSGSVHAEGFEFVKDAGSLTERYPSPYLFCWYNAAGKDGNRVVRFSAGGAHLQRYYLSQEDVSQLKTVIIAVRHMTVSQPVVTRRSGGNSYGHYKHDYDYDLYFFNLDTREWSSLDCVKHGPSSNYRGVNCKQSDAAGYVRALYAR